MLSITDESNIDVFDNYLETTLVGLEHCPMFFTANDLQKINHILADRCMVIPFPEASASRIKSIGKKYAEKKLASDLYSMIDFNYELLFKSIDYLVGRNITSLTTVSCSDLLQLTHNFLKGTIDMEVFLIMPTTPEGKAKLSKELAKFHAEQALKMVQKLPCSTEQKLELIDAVVEHLRSKQ